MEKIDRQKFIFVLLPISGKRCIVCQSENMVFESFAPHLVLGKPERERACKDSDSPPVAYRQFVHKGPAAKAREASVPDVRPGTCLVLLELRVELQCMQEEVEEVQIKAHREPDRLFPGVLGVAETEEVVQEVGTEDDHPEDRVEDVRRPAEAHEDADDAEDDQTEQGEHQIRAHAREVDAREKPDHPAHGHDAAGSSEYAGDGFPAQFLSVLGDHRPDEEARDEGPNGESADADARSGVGGEEDADTAEQEGDAESDHGHARADVTPTPGAGGSRKHAHRQQQGNFRVDSGFHRFILQVRLVASITSKRRHCRSSASRFKGASLRRNSLP